MVELLHMSSQEQGTYKWWGNGEIECYTISAWALTTRLGNLVFTTVNFSCDQLE